MIPLYHHGGSMTTIRFLSSCSFLEKNIFLFVLISLSLFSPYYTCKYFTTTEHPEMLKFERQTGLTLTLVVNDHLLCTCSWYNERHFKNQKWDKISVAKSYIFGVGIKVSKYMKGGGVEIWNHLSKRACCSSKMCNLCMKLFVRSMKDLADTCKEIL